MKTVYINPNVPTRTSQPPVIGLRGYDEPCLRDSIKNAGYMLPSAEAFDSYEAWEVRQKWLAELRRGKK